MSLTRVCVLPDADVAGLDLPVISHARPEEEYEGYDGKSNLRLSTRRIELLIR